MARAPPKKPQSPAEKPEILGQMKALYRKLTVEDRLLKGEAMKRVCNEFGFKHFSSYQYWTNPKVRQTVLDSNKNRPRPDRKGDEYRIREATRMHLYRHTSTYVRRVHDRIGTPLSLDDWTIELQRELVAEGRPKVMLKNSTLERIASEYDPSLLERVETTPELYALNPEYV